MRAILPSVIGLSLAVLALSGAADVTVAANDRAGRGPGFSAAPADAAPKAAAPSQPVTLAEAATIRSEHDRAVTLARAGNTKEALRILARLARRDRADLGIRRDQLVISGWAGKDKIVVALYRTLPPDEPAYVLAAAARAYRDLRRFREALALYREGARRFPGNRDFAEGVKQVQADMKTVAAAAAQKRVDDEHAHAVKLAREGKIDQALRMLDRLAARHPADLGIRRDQLVVHGWHGDAAKVVSLYRALPPGEPAYVVAAAAHAYRDLKRRAEALALYRDGLKRFPDDPDLVAGEALVMIDMNHAGDALELARTALAAKASVPVLLAAAMAADAHSLPVDALHYAQDVLDLDPNNRDAKRLRIFAIERMGAPHVALGLAEESPGLVSASELRRLELSDAAELVRFGPLEPPSQAQRFAAVDAAIKRLDYLIEQFSKLGDVAKDDVLRARFDRMLAYRDRVRMADVVKEYTALKSAGVKIPPYALAAAAAAYLYTRHPEKARKLYEAVLAAEPNDFEAAMGRFYALVESEDLDEAVRAIDQIDAHQPKWRWLKGDPRPLPRDERLRADEATGNARFYANELAAADQRLKALVDAAPGNTSLRASLGNVYAARGWPNRAQQEYDIASAYDPTDPAIQVDKGENALNLHDFPAAESAAQDLIKRYPESLDAQRLATEWDVHDRPELHISVAPTYESTTSVHGGSGIAFDSSLYSAPYGYNWRAYAGEYIAWEQDPEGNETLYRHATGIEWRDGPFTAHAEANANDYGHFAVGGGAGGAWQIDDEWNIAGQGEAFAKDTPLRALLNHVTANAISGTVTWRGSEESKVSLTGEGMNFSDENLRGSLDGKVTERLYTEPHFDVDGVFESAASTNSKTNVPYYNPRNDLLNVVGFDVSQVLYRRYEFHWVQKLSVRAGPYWEQGFGTSFAGNVTYEQRIETSPAFGVGAGITLGRQSYDGQYTNSVGVLFDLTWRPRL